MADQLYLSYWLRGFDERKMLRHFEKLLLTFPFSTSGPGLSTLRIHAVQDTEPPLLEASLDRPPDVATVIQTAAEFQSADCAYLLETHWDLWRYDMDWRLHPTGVLLACYAPQFENERGEQLRIEFGLDSHFLPQRQHPRNVARVRSNIQGLLRLTHELDDALPVEKRSLWTDSGEDFVSNLRDALVWCGASG